MDILSHICCPRNHCAYCGGFVSLHRALSMVAAVVFFSLVTLAICPSLSVSQKQLYLTYSSSR